MGVTILFLGANPSDSTRLALGQEVREIDHRLRAAEHRDVFRIEQAWAVRPSDLQECLLRHRPSIVHFSGHGSPAGQILLENESGKAAPVRPAALAKLFGILGRQVRCVVLNACYSEAQARAIVAHVDCVIGMSTAVKDSSAIAFAGAFYQALAYGKDVRSAFELGCIQMELVTGAASLRDLSPEGAGQGGEAQSAVPRLLLREGLEAGSLHLFEPTRASPGAVQQQAVEEKAEAPSEARERLREAQERRDALRAAQASTEEVDAEILELRREQRVGRQLRAGDTLGDGRYLLQGKIGRGGFAVVWRAVDRQLGKDVAIKVLHANLAGDPVRLERFYRGARWMAELGHEAVVRVREPHGEEEDIHYFVMDYVPGGDLRQAVLELRLPRERTIPVILRVAEALSAAHARGIVHRDVKPANILLDEEGEPKLTDFDLVGAAETTGGTRTGAMGTFVYAAPELMSRPQDADVRADVYALGMTALFCLSRAELPPEVLREPEEVLKALPCGEAVRGVLRRAIAWKPAGRFVDARAFGEALREAAAWEAKRRKGVRGAGWRRWMGGVATLLGLGAAGGVAWWRITHVPEVSPGYGGVGSATAPGTGAASAPASAGPVTSASAAAAGEGACPAEMVLIPGGTFKMGSNDGDDDEKPPHDAKVDSFCLDRTEVTVAAYTACVREKGCKAAWATVDWANISGDAERKLWGRFCNAERTERGEYPINCVDWDQADAFCKAHAKRLPTEPEWEYAARGGSEQRTHPWGEEAPGPELLNACGGECVKLGKSLGQTWTPKYPGDDRWAETAPVKSFPRGQSRWGAHDLAGNVWEWTGSHYCPYSGDSDDECTNAARVLRGGSWLDVVPAHVRAAGRVRLAPTWRYSDVGFRCARGPDQ